VLFLEHANITVRDIDAVTDFLRVACPSFQIRHVGHVDLPDYQKRWIHIGNDEQYLALEETNPGGRDNGDRYRDIGVNHLGFVVEDLTAVSERLCSAGFRQGQATAQSGSRKRAYFYDATGLEWEFIEYLTKDREKRNQYAPEQ
jgi:hypothetical protein